MINAVEMAEQLKGSYRVVFEKADLYGTLNGSVEPEVFEDKLMNLYDLLMEAQHEGKPVEKIIGPNVETFCKEYFQNEEKEKWWKQLPKKLFQVMRMLFVLELLDWLILNDQKRDLFTMTSDMTPFLFGLVLGFVLDFVLGAAIKPLIFKNKIKPYVYYLAITAIWFGCIIAGVIYLSDYEIQIPIFPIMLVSGIYVGVYLLITTVWRYKKLGRISRVEKAEKQVKKEFKKEVSDKYLEKASASGMAWRFKRLNKKKLRREKSELTQEEFAVKVRKEEDRTAVIMRWIWVVFAILIAGPSIYEMVTNSVQEGLLFGTILAVIEIPLFIFTKRSEVKNSRLRLNVLEHCEELGVTVVQYYESLKDVKE